LPVPLPPPGRVSVVATGAPPAFWEAIGYPMASAKAGDQKGGEGRALRVDMLDRLETEMLTLAKSGASAPEVVLGQRVGLSAEELAGVLSGLGYARSVAEDGAVTWKRRRPSAAKPRRDRAPVNADHPFAKLRQLSGG
jgi:ATP-dependent RNA helicase SUPV3L1/SUV3